MKMGSQSAGANEAQSALKMEAETALKTETVSQEAMRVQQ